MVDLALTIAVLPGFVVINPDVMADIKMAVPFIPLATVCFAFALVTRLFKSGHTPVKTTLRSNGGPAGLELAWLTFWICFPLLIAVFVWAFSAVIRNATPAASGK